MSRDSEITPAPLSPSALSPAIMRASATLKLGGNTGFWLQIVLGVVAALILLFASVSFFGEGKPSPGIGLGLFCAACGVFALVVSIVFFYRYKRLARLMQNPNPALRPKKSYTLQVINLGLTSNLIGMSISIVGAEALVGLLLGKFLNLPQGAVTSTIDPNQLLKGGEIMIILANTHTIASHFAGIVIALWLLNRLNR